jgi:hypothetical protein
MNQRALNEDFVKKYLLGDIDEVARQRLEERLLTDEEFFQEFAALEDRLEDTLIDEYVGGEMSARASADFESVFLAAPHRVEKLRLVRGLHEYVNLPAPAAAAGMPEEESPRAPTDTAPRWWPFPSFINPARPYVSLALVLALLSATIGAAMFYAKSRRLEAELGALRSQRPAEQGTSDELSRLRARNEELAADLRQADERLNAELRREEAEGRGAAAPTPTTEPARETASQTKPARVVALALSLGGTRAGDGQAMPERELPADATGLRLTLNLDTVDPGDYQSFRDAGRVRRRVRVGRGGRRAARDHHAPGPAANRRRLRRQAQRASGGRHAIPRRRLLLPHHQALAPRPR